MGQGAPGISHWSLRGAKRRSNLVGLLRSILAQWTDEAVIRDCFVASLLAMAECFLGEIISLRKIVSVSVILQVFQSMGNAEDLFTRVSDALEHEPKRVVELLPHLKDLNFSRWLPIFDSESAQQGLRILSFPPGSQGSFSFNLNSDKAGYGNLEIKQFDGKEMQFGEARFFADGAELFDERFIKGVHYSQDVLNDDHHGKGKACSECHSGGTSRFDLREILGKLRAPDKMRLSVLRFNHRFGSLKLTPEEAKALYKNDRGRLSEIWTRRAREIAAELAAQNAKVIASRFQPMFERSPLHAILSLAVFKGCDIDKIPPQETVERTLQYWLRHRLPGKNSVLKKVAENIINGDVKLSKAAEALKAHMQNERSPKSFGVRTVVGNLTRIGYKLDPSEHPKKTDDPKLVTDPINLDKLAKLELVLDPLVAGFQRAQPENERMSLFVRHWSMTAHHRSYWFDGHFGLIEKELQRAAQKVGQKLSGLSAKPSCSELAKAAQLEIGKKQVFRRSRQRPPHPGSEVHR